MESIYSLLYFNISPAVMTPSTPVTFKHLSTSGRYCILPLAYTGIFTCSLKSKVENTFKLVHGNQI